MTDRALLRELETCGCRFELVTRAGRSKIQVRGNRALLQIARPELMRRFESLFAILREEGI